MAGAEPTAPDDEEQALKRVLEESERAERERVAALAKQKSDEEIVMEYVKRQSLAEEEHRRRLAAEGKEQGEGSGPAS
jgi:3-methyladenine DNA glycosylase AlkC